MPTVRLVLRYDGTRFSGLQRQVGVPTVQEAVEKAVAEFVGERVTLHAAGRTDAGVHAFAQIASFRTAAVIPEKGWRMGLTKRLPPDVVVTDARIAQDDFDPRRASAGKRYRYVLLLGQMRDPLMRDRAWHLYGGFDRKLLHSEAPHFIGTHDFSAFRAADCERKTTVRTLYDVRVVEGWHGRHDLVAIEVEGTAFLKNMVRVMVGTMVDVARGRLAPGTVAACLEGRDRTHAGMTAPPQGLYLDEVFVRPEWLLPNDVLRPHPAYAAEVLSRAKAFNPNAPEAPAGVIDNDA